MRLAPRRTWLRRSRPAWAEIDLAAVRHNAALLRRLAAPAALCAVVKADAYGHGAVAVARAALEGGATWLAVALVEEGVELREAGIDAPVLRAVRAAGRGRGGGGGRPASPRPSPARGPPTPSAAAPRRRGGAPPVHVKVDTGMHRVGRRLRPTCRGWWPPCWRRPPLCGWRGSGPIWRWPTRLGRGPGLHRRAAGRFDAGAGRAGGRRRSATGPARRQLGRGHRLARGPLRHGPLRHRPLRRAPLADRGRRPGRRRPAAEAAAPRAVAAGPGAGRARSSRPASAPPTAGCAPLPERSVVATVPLGYADGVPRRYFGAGGERADRRAAPPAGRHGDDGPDRGGLRARRRRWPPGDEVVLHRPPGRRGRSTRDGLGRAASAPSATRCSAGSGHGCPGCRRRPATEPPVSRTSAALRQSTGRGRPWPSGPAAAWPAAGYALSTGPSRRWRAAEDELAAAGLTLPDDLSHHFVDGRRRRPHPRRRARARARRSCCSTGSCSASAVWAHQFRDLADHHRVIAVDLRGHGQSIAGTAATRFERLADDLCEVLEALDVARRRAGRPLHGRHGGPAAGPRAAPSELGAPRGRARPAWPPRPALVPVPGGAGAARGPRPRWPAARPAPSDAGARAPALGDLGHLGDPGRLRRRAPAGPGRARSLPCTADHVADGHGRPLIPCCCLRRRRPARRPSTLPDPGRGGHPRHADPARAARCMAGGIPEARSIVLPGCGHMVMLERADSSCSSRAAGRPCSEPGRRWRRVRCRHVDAAWRGAPARSRRSGPRPLGCTRCPLAAGRTQVVFGVGDPDGRSDVRRRGARPRRGPGR